MPEDPSPTSHATTAPQDGASQRTVYPYRFGEVGVLMGLLDRDKVREALTTQKSRKLEGKNPLVGEIMVERGWITPRQVAAILVAQKRYRSDSQAPQAGLAGLTGSPQAAPAPAPAPAAAPAPKRNSERHIAAAAPKKSSERRIPAAAPSSAPAAPAQAQRQKLGEFELIRKLGEGAMGQVFEAFSSEKNRNIALKILPRQLAQDQEFVERFKREIKLMGALNHPHIVELYDAGVAGGYYYYAMEFVDGETLDKRLKRDGKMAEKDALRIGREMALGLAHAHAKGMIHRDIKPENIMLTKTGMVKITDFGLAKPTEDKQHLTAAGFSIGTPFYISPEQALGKERIDHRADLYGLGAAIFHLLT
ncbi:MAG: serine/threonine protein kinase, partial [Planctomycetes bacterium]|nr:serine/threonine protein kinase [Planctomycetota bacterium]